MAILGSVGTAIYRHGLSAYLTPEVHAQLTGPAQNNLGSTLKAVGHLSASIGPAARQAFTDGLVAACAISSVIALVAAIVVATLYRRTTRPTV